MPLRFAQSSYALSVTSPCGRYIGAGVARCVSINCDCDMRTWFSLVFCSCSFQVVGLDLRSQAQRPKENV